MSRVRFAVLIAATVAAGCVGSAFHAFGASPKPGSADIINTSNEVVFVWTSADNRKIQLPMDMQRPIQLKWGPGNGVMRLFVEGYWTGTKDDQTVGWGSQTRWNVVTVYSGRARVPRVRLSHP